MDRVMVSSIHPKWEQIHPNPDHNYSSVSFFIFFPLVNFYTMYRNKSKATKTSNPKKLKKESETVTYVRSIDVSSITGESVSIIIDEITNDISEVISSDDCVDTLRVLIEKCNTTNLIKLFNIMDINVIFRWSGAKTFENILNKMNEINQETKNDSFCELAHDKMCKLDINEFINGVLNEFI